MESLEAIGAPPNGRAPGKLQIIDLGLVNYARALELQRNFREKRLAGETPDLLLLLEHPPTITFGRRATEAELLVSRQDLSAKGIGLFEVERGGMATYHGPGQLVGYPIVDIRGVASGVQDYVKQLEQVIVDFLHGLGIEAHRKEGAPGVWVGEKKIASIGVHLRRWVSIHGFAINLCPDLSHFKLIVPCGDSTTEMTSVRAELRWNPSMLESKRLVANCLVKRFGYSSTQASSLA